MDSLPGGILRRRPHQRLQRPLHPVRHPGTARAGGPRQLTKVNLSAIKNYWFTWGMVCGVHNVLIARTGYTGEDGFEIYIPSDEPTSARVWEEVTAAGKEFGLLACGLGARNTLRLEAAMALYGHEISEEINLLEAGLERFSKLGKSDFLGGQALLQLKQSGAPKRKLVGLEMIDRGIARYGYKVCSLEGEAIGYVTSGSPSPYLKITSPSPTYRWTVPLRERK